MVGDLEQDLLAEAKKRGLPYLIVLNKTDLLADPAQIDEKAGEIAQALAVDPAKVCPVSTDPAQGIGELKERLAKLQPKEAERPLIRDLLEEGDLVVLVVPIDSAAPKGRLILPQQQVIRDSLEAGAIPVVVRDTELSQALAALGKKAPPCCDRQSGIWDSGKDCAERHSFDLIFYTDGALQRRSDSADRRCAGD